jgi:hypothetical protein
VHVGIDDKSLAHGVVSLQSPDGHGHVVNHAEAFAVAGKRVVESTADIDSEAVFQGALSGENRSAGSQPESSDGRLRIGNFQAHALAGAERVVLELIHPFARVHAQDILVGGWFGSEDIRGLGDVLGEQEVADHSEFLRLEYVLAQAQVITFVIDELERQHGPGELMFAIEDEVGHGEKRASKFSFRMPVQAGLGARGIVIGQQTRALERPRIAHQG